MLNRLRIGALAFVLAFSLMPASAFAAVSSHDLVAVQAAGATQLALGSPVAITEGGAYEITGTGAGPVSIAGEIEVTLVLNGVSIDATGTGASAISVTGGARVTLQVVGGNTVTGDVNQAGIQVDKDSELTVEGGAEVCSLSAAGNAGVDYGTVADGTAAGNTRGAGIGGTSASPDAGTITVNGNGTLALSAVGGGLGAAGIGSAYGGGAGTIAISDTALGAVHGGCLNAAAEKDDGYAKNTLEGGPAIGGGTRGKAGGIVIIRNCTGSDIVGGGKASGIGGGCWAQDARVEIYGSTLTVVGGTTGPAIGSGRVTTGSAASVLISGSTVTATGGYHGAGIGLGINASNDELGVSDVTISNSVVTATGGAGAAGIGGGARGYNVNVTINEGSQVAAYSGPNYMGSYTTRYNGSADTVTEDGGIGQAGAAAIGRGAWGSVTKFAGYEEEAGVALSISADSQVTALSNGDNWAVAGFRDWEGVAATLLQARFDRNYDLAGSDLLSQSASGNADALYLDGVRATDLVVKDAETNEIVKTINMPAVGEDFAHGFAGGRVGYYAFATTLPGAGTYTVNTSSELRTSMAAGDELIGPDDERYRGGADYLDGTVEVARYECKPGVNAFDGIVFATQAVPDPEPVPEPTPGPDSASDTPTTVSPEAKDPSHDSSDSRPEGDSGGKPEKKPDSATDGTSRSKPEGGKRSDDSQASTSKGASQGDDGSSSNSGSEPTSGSGSSMPQTGDLLFPVAYALVGIAACSAFALLVARRKGGER